MKQNISDYIGALGIQGGPMPSAGIQAAIGYFDARLPKVAVEDRLSFLKGMDFHKPVEIVPLKAGLQLAAWRDPSGRVFGYYYAQVGATPRSLGICADGKQYHRYRVRRSCLALKSWSTSIRTEWDKKRPRFLASGGIVQYVIGDASSYLEVIV